MRGEFKENCVGYNNITANKGQGQTRPEDRQGQYTRSNAVKMLFAKSRCPYKQDPWINTM